MTDAPVNSRVPRRSPRLAAAVASAIALAIGGAVVSVTPANEGEKSPPDPSYETTISLTAKEQSHRAWAERNAKKAGALDVGLSTAGDVVALFPAGEPVPDVRGIPARGIRLKVSPFTREEYREATRVIRHLARTRSRIDAKGRASITSDYSYGYSHDVDTGQIRLRTDAPALHVQSLRHRFPDILTIRHEKIVAAASAAEI